LFAILAYIDYFKVMNWQRLNWKQRNYEELRTLLTEEKVYLAQEIDPKLGIFMAVSASG
jgi:D-aminopeptidase